MKILIAEDDDIARELIADLLQQEGYDVVQAADGALAWQEFEHNEFALVISDWLMPETDGLELCRRIRSAQQSTYPYIILLTALKGKNYFLEGMQAGADDFISKPFDADEFRAKLHVASRIVSLQKRVNTLEGVLPTCMYCKKIRDDKNDWVTLEQYVTERSNAAFSHGVCPQCYAQAAAEFK